MKKHSWSTARFRRVTTAAVVAFATFAVACDESTGPGGVVGVDVAILPIGTPTSNIERGESVQLIAAPHDANDQFVNTAVTWSSSNTAIATVDADGTVLGVEGAAAGGDVTITATAGGKSGTFELNFQKPAATVTISPATAPTIRREGAITFTATVLDVDGEPAASRTVNWSASSAGATVTPASSTTDASGQASTTVAGVTDGTVTITATAENNEVADVSGTRDVIVFGAPLVATVTVTATQTFGGIGQSFQASHSSAAASGTAIPGTTADWSSSNTAVATVDPVTGMVTLVGEGTASIRADVDNGAGTDVRGSLTIRSAPVLVSGVGQATGTIASGTSKYWALIVPAGTTGISITTDAGTTGDGDLFMLRAGINPPTPPAGGFGTIPPILCGTSGVCYSAASGNLEAISATGSNAPAAGTYPIAYHAWTGSGFTEDVTGVTLTATITP